MTPNERRFTNLTEALPRIADAVNGINDPDLRHRAFDLLVSLVDDTDTADQWAWTTTTGSVPGRLEATRTDLNVPGFDPLNSRRP